MRLRVGGPYGDDRHVRYTQSGGAGAGVRDGGRGGGASEGVPERI